MRRLNPVLAATFMRLVASVVLLGLLTVRIAAQDKEFEELKRLFDYDRGRPIDLVAGRPAVDATRMAYVRHSYGAQWAENIATP